MGQFLDGFFHVGAQFNPIGLSDGEIALFTAVLAFSPCRPGLGDIKLIATLQTLYQQAFFHLLKKNNSGEYSEARFVLCCFVCLFVLLNLFMYLCLIDGETKKKPRILALLTVTMNSEQELRIKSSKNVNSLGISRDPRLSSI